MRGHVPGEPLSGHAPAVGGYGAAPQIDRRVTRKASSGQRMDGSGRSEASPATTYSVFTANGSVATGQMVRSSVAATTLALTKSAFSWKTALGSLSFLE